jgi:hypothetical protein
MTCCTPNLSADLTAYRISTWNPIPAVTTAPLADGVTAPSATGTATARTVTNPSPLMRAARRIGYVSAAVINSVGGARAGQAIMFNGGAAIANPRIDSAGYWKLSFTWGISDAALNPEARMFVGAETSLVAPTAVDPATILNAIGFGCDNGETTLRLYGRDGGANTTEIDLGAGFPVNTADVTAHRMYRTVIECFGAAANPVRYRWQAYNLDSGAVAEGEITGLGGPAVNVVMAPRLWRATGPVSALATGIDLVHMKLVTKF